MITPIFPKNSEALLSRVDVNGNLAMVSFASYIKTIRVLVVGGGIKDLPVINVSISPLSILREGSTISISGGIVTIICINYNLTALNRYHEDETYTTTVQKSLFTGSGSYFEFPGVICSETTREPVSVTASSAVCTYNGTDAVLINVPVFLNAYGTVPYILEESFYEKISILFP